MRTYIQSGNVIFEAGENNGMKLRNKLEAGLSETFRTPLRLVIRSAAEMTDIIDNVPDKWNTGADIRKYIAFIRKPVTPGKVLKYVKPREGVDEAAAGPGAVYLSTKLSGITKTGFTKLIVTPIYKDLTMRKYNTVRKLLTYMQ